MKRTVLAVAAATLIVPFAATLAMAGPIERACLSSDRKAVSRAMCGCIQQAADMTLRGSDQRKAAQFFKDPDRAQQVRMSKSDADNEFWTRYKNFGTTAEAFCAG
ncbi:MAG: hypothetical protein KF887_05980 [Paracoccaceae bacterium]|nr:MAG: hypothetical protein KF887_05980 [Paracoccaceae bacterium]